MTASLFHTCVCVCVFSGELQSLFLQQAMDSSSEEARVRRAIIDSAVENYDLLAQSQETNKKVSGASTEAQLESNLLGDDLVKLQTYTQSMTQAGSQWRKEKLILNSAVVQHQKLLSLMEAPGLVDDCIRNDMYHEALLVLEHMTRSYKYAGQVELFQRLHSEMRRTLETDLEEVVLPRLSGPMTVDAAFKVVTFLRRLGFVNEQLRGLFLQRRGAYVDRMMQDAESSPVPYSRILKCTTVYKVHVSEVILQYSACFPSPSKSTEGLAWDDELREWCHVRSSHFLRVFAAAMDSLSNGSELALVVEQCHSCSASVAKVHLDVAASLNDIIVRNVKRLFAEQMANAVNAYKTSMLTFSWRMPSYTSSSLEMSGRDGGNSGGPMAGVGKGGIGSSPPMQLAQWLPLAYALNGFLSAANSIRKCLLPGLDIFCCERIEDLLRHIAGDLLRDGELMASMDRAERGVFSSFVTAFVDCFYPYLLQCTSALLGGQMERWVESGVGELIQRLRPWSTTQDKPVHPLPIPPVTVEPPVSIEAPPVAAPPSAPSLSGPAPPPSAPAPVSSAAAPLTAAHPSVAPAPAVPAGPHPVGGSPVAHMPATAGGIATTVPRAAPATLADPYMRAPQQTAAAAAVPTTGAPQTVPPARPTTQPGSVPPGASPWR